jgi:hypothetical protein
MNDEAPDPPVKRKRGRPRLANPLASVTIGLPAALLARLDRLARERNTSTSAIVRQLLKLRSRENE